MKILKPCPFCGGKADIITGVTDSLPNYPKVRIVCKKCRVGTDDYVDTTYDASFIDAVVNAWNKRVYE